MRRGSSSEVAAVEVWLRSNRRVLGMALAPAAALTIVGMLIATRADAAPVRVVGGALAALGAAMLVGLTLQMRRPRIAYRDGEVLFFLRAGAPVAAPAEVVEAFFVGQGPALLPSAAAGAKAETVNLVARLSQKAPEWTHQSVKQALGNWCDGYVTIRGTWCEPLTGELVRRLNHRLRELRETRGAVLTGAKTTIGGRER
jgi:hypothetical protein